MVILYLKADASRVGCAFKFEPVPSIAFMRKPYVLNLHYVYARQINDIKDLITGMDVFRG